MTRPAVVCDTTVLLYLGRIAQADLLHTLFEPVYIPEAVLLELDMGRLMQRDTIDPRRSGWAQTVHVSSASIDRLPSNRLGRGERAVIAYAYSHDIDLVGLDDLQARQLAAEMKLAVIGTLGIMLRAKRAGLIPAVRPLVDAVIAQGFRLRPDLYQDVLRLAQEDALS